MQDPQIITLAIPADAAFVRTVRQVVGAAANVIPDRIDDVRLAVSEAIALALSTGSDLLELTIAMTDDALSITVPQAELPEAAAPDEVDVAALIDALTDAAIPSPAGLVLTWVIDTPAD